MSNIEWPAWRYGPNGEQAVFDHEAYVPEGWASTPFPGVDYSGHKPSAAEADAVAALNAKLAEAAETIAAKDAEIEKLKADAVVAERRGAGFQAGLDDASKRAAAAVEAAKAELEALKAEHAKELDGFRVELAKAREQIAKFDGDKDGRVGGKAKAQ